MYENNTNNSVIFENYINFLTDNETIFKNPNAAHKLTVDSGLFESYLDSLTTGINDPRTAAVCKAVCHRNREMLLEAMSGSTSQAMGWTVMSFPILVDIYREPNVAEIANIYPIDKPLISVPKANVKYQTRSYDGASVEEGYLPTGTKRVGAGLVRITVPPNSMTNIFSSQMYNPEYMKMNKRFTILNGIEIVEKNIQGNTVSTFNVDVMVRPDSRNQLVCEFEFNDSNAEVVTGVINGNVNYDKGIINFSVNFIGGTSGHTYECIHADFDLRFIPQNTMNGRTKISIVNEVRDISIDPNEDFVIDISEEEMQDYSSIFKIDIVRTLSDVIKRQILLNKDFELSYFLKAAESEMRKYGTYLVVDLTKYRDMNNYLSPNNIADIYRTVSPAISTLFSFIRKNFNMEPTYLLAGLKTAAMLRTMQDLMAVNLPDLRGEIGFSGVTTSKFMKMKILECYTIEDNTIYMVTKPGDNALQYASIVDFVFQPMYVIKEITDGNTRQFVRSRTSIEILRTNGMGCIKVLGLDQFSGVTN